MKPYVVGLRINDDPEQGESAVFVAYVETETKAVEAVKAAEPNGKDVKVIDVAPDSYVTLHNLKPGYVGRY